MCQVSLSRATSSSGSLMVLALILAPQVLAAAPPTANDVDVYSSLCKIGSQTTVVVSGELGAISRRILAGEAKLSASNLQDEFPGIRDEQNRLLALQSFQDCMYKYIDRFHSATSAEPQGPAVLINPTVAPERRREIIYLANEVETFKQKMAKTITALPPTFYDKRDSTEKNLKDDPRLIGLDNYSRYKAFQSAAGGLDFSNATNSDLVLLCNTYGDEIDTYKGFSRQFRPLNLPPYTATNELRRICAAATRGR